MNGEVMIAASLLFVATIGKTESFSWVLIILGSLVMVGGLIA